MCNHTKMSLKVIRAKVVETVMMAQMDVMEMTATMARIATPRLIAAPMTTVLARLHPATSCERSIFSFVIYH